MDSLFFGKLGHGRPVTQAYYESEKLFFCEALVYFDDAVSNNLMYAARIIEIEPYFSWVRWGGGIYYPKPILHKWKSIDLSDASFTAEKAVQVAEENGGKEARLREDNQCNISVDSEGDRKWRVDYFGADFEVLVDMRTGKVKILKNGS
jgi:hypothetical protein